MTNNDLKRNLLNEVPAPGTDYWARIDALVEAEMTMHEEMDTGAHSDVGGELVDIGVGTASVTDGDGRRRRGGWVLLAAAAALVVVAAVFVTNQLQRESTLDFADAGPRGADAASAAVAPLAGLDHWNSIYAVWDCTANDGAGAWVPPFQSTVDDWGIHSHGDGLISIHPFVEESAGVNARFGLFAESMGITVDAEAITLDDGTRLTAGSQCGGEPAVVHLRRWQFDFLATGPSAIEPTVITENINAERFLNDREVWVLALAPIDAELADIPTDRFDRLDARTAVDPADLETLEPREVPQRPNMPFGDVFFDVQPGLGDDELALDLLQLRASQNGLQEPLPIVSDSTVPIQHVALLTSSDGGRPLDVFRGGSAESPCFAVLSSTTERTALYTCAENSSSPQARVDQGDRFTALQVTSQLLDSRGIAIWSERP